MAINIYSVSNHLEENGWQLISDTYKNLDTELEMICPKGHKQKQTYRHWRKHLICEECLAGDPFKGKKNNVPLKKNGTYRILALDAATTVTGYSIYDDEQLVAYGTFKTNISNDSTERINEVKVWLEAAVKEWQPDYIGIENIQLQNYGKNNFQVETYRVLANLQGVLVDTIWELNIPHSLVYAVEWRKYCGISDGDTKRENKKRQAQDKVKLWYGQDCTQDEADAICIGKYFCKYAKSKKSSWGEDI
jgi:Holliday junction resolvasome RuvABC endonuclease subunit